MAGKCTKPTVAYPSPAKPLPFGRPTEGCRVTGMPLVGDPVIPLSLLAKHCSESVSPLGLTLFFSLSSPWLYGIPRSSQVQVGEDCITWLQVKEGTSGSGKWSGRGRWEEGARSRPRDSLSVTHFCSPLRLVSSPSRGLGAWAEGA